jgi:xanthine/uracil permease
MIMKPNEKAEIPIGVIVGSVIAGILLLMALVAILWKVRKASYFKIPGFQRPVLNFLKTAILSMIWHVLYHARNASLFMISHSCL